MDRWFRHLEYGVATQLATIPRQTPEATEDPEVTAPVIYNDIEHGCVASGFDPDEVPAIVVFIESGMEVPAQNVRRPITQSAVVSVAYITRDTFPADASRDGGYVLRAVRQSLFHFNSQDKSRNYRLLNDIKILSVNSVRQERVSANIGKSDLWGFVVAELSVIDDSGNPE